MENATISIRIDKQLKNEFDDICDNFGMNISTAIIIFAKKVVAERKIPFDITENVKYDLTAEKTPKMKLKEVFEEAQRQSVLNGTDNLTMDDINDIIAEERRKERGL